ncbi:MAG: carboxypeptidase-like regulatory domain-containing protein, partial [Candidatus Limnocylindria bacterium]
SAAVPSAPPPATPWPTPDPKVWRFEGRVVTEAGEPLARVCVVIGPLGCRQHGPHTDDQGRYYIDMPQNPTIVYELRFEKEGYGTVYYRMQPQGPTVFNVVLKPS